MAATIHPDEVSTIIIVCEAGVGSSLIVVNQTKKKLQKANVEGYKVIHKPARLVPEDAKMIICHKGLSKLVRKRVPGAVVVAFTMFLNDPAIDRVVSALANGTEIHEEG